MDQVLGNWFLCAETRLIAVEEPVLRDSPTGRYIGGELPKPLVKILGKC